MKDVRIIAVTKPVDNLECNVDEFIAYVARISNPGNQSNKLTAKKLIKYLLKNKHFSPFEMVNVVFEINTTRDIGRQILRHGSCKFQEFCIAGNSMITLEFPKGVNSERRGSYKRSIECLYKLQEKNKKMLPTFIRVYDEESKTFINSKIKEVFKTGIKPVFKITLYNGKEIVTTKEHKFLTKNGFQTLEKAIDLKINGKTATMSKNIAFACNGIPIYQNKEWLTNAKKESIIDGSGIAGIAEKAHIGYDTMRKWLKKLDLVFTKKEVSQYTIPWNKGNFGYNRHPHSEETIEKTKKSAKKGCDRKIWSQNSSAGLLTVEWSEVKKVEYIGEQMTYDLEVEHTSHNYVANGIVTHNSQRYSDINNIGLSDPKPARFTDHENRQNSIVDESRTEIMAEWLDRQQQILDLVEKNYRWAIDNDVAKEVARVILPEGLTKSRLYVNGTLRSWIHYCQSRIKNGTQLEHSVIATEIVNQLIEMFPSISELEF